MNAVERYDEKSNELIHAKHMNVHISGLSVCVVMGFQNVCDYIQEKRMDQWWGSGRSFFYRGKPKNPGGITVGI
jgi:hypothetical protein